MHPPVRDQGDILSHQFTPDEVAEFEPSISCTAEEDKARQEFKNEADVNWLLKKYGALPPVQSFPIGETDFDVDLQTAKLSIEAARTGYDTLPPEFRRVVGFERFLSSLASGQPFPPAPKAEVSSAAGAGSQPEGGSHA